MFQSFVPVLAQLTPVTPPYVSTELLETFNESVFVAVCCAESETWNVRLNNPAALGTPVIEPDVAARASAPGRFPELIDQV
jgi:hypothetical protein